MCEGCIDCGGIVVFDKGLNMDFLLIVGLIVGILITGRLLYLTYRMKKETRTR